VITIGVTSVGSGVGQSVLRSLAASELDHRVVGLDPGAYNSGAHWVDAAYVIPWARDEDEYRTRVLDIVAAEGIQALVPCVDPELPVIAGMRAQLAELGCTAIVSEPDVIAVSDDKLATAEWASSHGLPFVATRTLPDAQDHADELVYPVIVKPRRGSSSAGIRLALDADALRREIGDDQTIVQPFLPPRDRALALTTDVAAGVRIEQLHEVSAQYVVGESGHILGSFVSLNRLRAGIPVQIEPVVDAAWVDDGRPFVEALIELGARGPVNLQGRLDADGRVQFFELNARFTGITGVRTLMGFREVEAAVRALVLDDEDGASAALTFDHRLVGLRHVGDMVVGAERIAQLVDEGSLQAERSRPTARRIVVSGASSYVGRTAVAALVADGADEVHALVRSETSEAELTAEITDPRLHVHRVDLLDDTIELPPADVVLHLAGVRAGNDAPPFLHEVNVEGTRRLLRAARQAGIARFAYLSTQAVYGLGRPPLWGESLPPRPETPYATSKWLGEEMCREEVVDGIQLLVLRAGRVYGLAAGMRWDELPHEFARKTAKGDGLTIHGDGRQRMDFVHVDDVADALLRCAAAELPGPGRIVLNLGGGHPVSLRELAATYRDVATTLGLDPPPVEHVARSGPAAPSFGMHIRRARAVLGWSPATPLTDAVRELVEAAL
jgi:nucleoside-diphosphate-sugar epimerase